VKNVGAVVTLKLQRIHVEHAYHALGKDINIKIIFKDKKIFVY